MSKLACRCGHVIVDQTDDLPYKAAILPNGQEQEFFTGAAQLANDLLVAASAGKVDELLDREYAKGPWRPRPTEYFEDRLSSVYLACTSTAYECSRCGRLWLQKPGLEDFVSFAPDSGHYEAVLAVDNPLAD
ncbi:MULTISPECIES: hypothetical protein [Pseudomonas]|uniref:Uncharacterized protein n=1 Tax=Pseudomonas piscis TaxID=2614538 RepID=A0ABY9NAG2_9PSED|nr:MULTISPECIES: hypothetical protein [Pseudomonas]POA57373.1 hypothetical protein C1889_07430 [Pseudomonas sp. FW507-12TSA]WMN15461.1 hypothetical protein QL104_19050 [Pseudomonas piscis]